MAESKRPLPKPPKMTPAQVRAEKLAKRKRGQWQKPAHKLAEPE